MHYLASYPLCTSQKSYSFTHPDHHIQGKRSRSYHCAITVVITGLFSSILTVFTLPSLAVSANSFTSKLGSTNHELLHPNLETLEAETVKSETLGVGTLGAGRAVVSIQSLPVTVHIKAHSKVHKVVQHAIAEVATKVVSQVTTKNEIDKELDTSSLFNLATSLSILQGVNLTNQQYDLLYQSFDQIHQQAAEITSIEQRLAFVNTLRSNQNLNSAVTAMNLSDDQEYELDSLLQIFAFQVMSILTPEQVQTIFDNIDQSDL